jgi:hypothetical protein
VPCAAHLGIEPLPERSSKPFQLSNRCLIELLGMENPCLLTVSAPPAYTDAAVHFIMVSSIDPGAGGSFLRMFDNKDGTYPSFFICSLTNS